MQKKEQISHTGNVISIEPEIIKVRIIVNSSCASCSVKGSCSVSEIEEKIVDVPAPKKHNYQKGDFVTVVLDRSKAFQALFLGYIMPFFVLLFSLLLALSITKNQGLAGLFALGSLIPYYLLLYAFRKSIRQQFDFRLV